MEGFKKLFFLFRFIAIACCLIFLTGCGETDTQTEIKLLQEKLGSFEAYFEVARDRLENPLAIEFQGLDYVIKDQMFDPLLSGTVMIQASHKHLPQYAYLQLQVNVGFEEQKDVQLAKTFWVNLVGGKGKASFQISLPEHQLDNVKASITFTPLSWHSGHPVTFSPSVLAKPAGSVVHQEPQLTQLGE